LGSLVSGAFLDSHFRGKDKGFQGNLPNTLNFFIEIFLISDTCNAMEVSMRRLCAFAFLLSLAGLTISAILLVMHYSPEMVPAWVPCGEVNSPCNDLARSSYSTIFGVPVASFGVLFYLWIVVMTGILLVSGYIRSGLVFLMLGVSSVAFGVDIALGVMLIVTQSFCPLCISTYFLNLLLLVVFIIIARDEKLRDTKVFSKVCRSLLSCLADPFERFGLLTSASLAFFIIVTVVFAVVSLSLYRDQRFSRGDLIRQMSERFASQPAILKNYPATPLMTGTSDAKVKVAVFSDPFCPPCLEYSLLEEKLRGKYGPNVVFYHYMFPLDKKCNSSSKSSPHPYACEGSGYMIAAGKMGLYDSFISSQREKIAMLTKIYARKAGARKIFEAMIPGSIDADAARFESIASSKEVSNLVARDILFGQSVGVRHTPTVYISGKEVKDRLVFDLLDSLVDNALRNSDRQP
jgi:uncharacterized membrane protein